MTMIWMIYSMTNLLSIEETEPVNGYGIIMITAFFTEEEAMQKVYNRGHY